MEEVAKEPRAQPAQQAQAPSVPLGLPVHTSGGKPKAEVADLV